MAHFTGNAESSNELFNLLVSHLWRFLFFLAFFMKKFDQFGVGNVKELFCIWALNWVGHDAELELKISPGWRSLERFRYCQE